jgi:hypothetical protein
MSYKALDRQTAEIFENPLFNQIFLVKKYDTEYYDVIDDSTKLIDYWDPENTDSPDNHTDIRDYYPLFKIGGKFAGPNKGDDLARITLGIWYRDCGIGIGDVAKIRFKTGNCADKCNTYIQFDPEFNPEAYVDAGVDFALVDKRLSKNLVLYDCISFSNIKALIDTQIDAKIKIS